MHSSTRAELRQFPRRSVGHSQLLTIDVVRQNGPAQHGIVLNVSEGGAAVQLLGTSRGDGVSKVRLNFPAYETPLETSARLAWIGPDGRAGVHFEGSLSEIQSAIREWLRSQPVASHEFAPEPKAEFAPELDEFGATLGIIAERAMARTGAKGAAIAVGSREFMVCCATVGAAPALQAPLRPDSGLSGNCLRSGTDLYCMDALHDERIDPGIAEQLNMRSAALLPITVSGNVVGILELFSDEPNAFGAATTRDRLGRLLQFLAAAIEQYQPAKETVQKPLTSQASSTGIDTVVAPLLPAEAPTAEQPPFAEETPSITEFRDLLTLEPPRRSGMLTTVLLVLILLAAAIAAFWYYTQKQRAPRTPVDEQSYQSASAAADAVPPLVGLAPSSVSARAGDPFSIDIVLSNAQNISSAGLLIVHDQNTMKVVGISAGDLLGPSGTIVHREQSGQLQVTASVPGSSAPISGSGILCTVYFLAKSPGKSTISINELSLRDSAMRPATAQSSDATVTITR